MWTCDRHTHTQCPPGVGDYSLKTKKKKAAQSSICAANKIKVIFHILPQSAPVTDDRLPVLQFFAALQECATAAEKFRLYAIRMSYTRGL